MNRMTMIVAPMLLAITTASVAAQPPAKAPAKMASAFPRPAANACALPPKNTTFSFWQSCKNVTMNGCTLQASCQKMDGSWRNATFDMSIFSQCYSDFFGGRNLVNSDGKLCCGYAGTPVICGT